jgi:hypothetical protein
MKMTYKVGDVVTIRNDLKASRSYKAEGGKYIANIFGGMINRKGEKVRITRVEHDGRPTHHSGEWYAYHVCGYKTMHNLWTYEMFEEGKNL